MSIPDNCVVGTFIREEKNRFLCTVEVNGTQKRCYIASSCRLDNFLKLKGKKVLLIPTSSKKATTEYSVLAVKHKRSFLVLNTAMANRAIENSFPSRKLAEFGKRKVVLKEHKVENYKTDFYIPHSKTIIEVKSVISMSESAAFPTVFSERTMRQLSEIEKMLTYGYSARFVIVALNPYTKGVTLQGEQPFYESLKRCMDKGLAISAFTCRLGQDGIPRIDKRISITFPDNC